MGRVHRTVGDALPAASLRPEPRQVAVLLVVGRVGVLVGGVAFALFCFFVPSRFVSVQLGSVCFVPWVES